MVQIQAHSILIGFDIDSLLNRTISALGNIFIDALRLSLSKTSEIGWMLRIKNMDKLFIK